MYRTDSDIFKPQFNQITFSTHISLSSSGTPIMWILVYLLFSNRYPKLFPFFYFFLFWLRDFPYAVFPITCVLFPCMCVFLVQLCLTLCDPMDCSPPGSSVCGILQARILERVAICFPRDLPNPGIEPESPALQVDSSPPEPPSSCSKCVISLILSSVSLFSSVSLVCCLFLQGCFSFATVFSSSDWFFYSFSSSLLKLCSSILFLSSVSVLITNALDSLSGAWVLGMDWVMHWGGWGKPN